MFVLVFLCNIYAQLTSGKLGWDKEKGKAAQCWLAWKVSVGVYISFVFSVLVSRVMQSQGS